MNFQPDTSRQHVEDGLTYNLPREGATTPPVYSQVENMRMFLDWLREKKNTDLVKKLPDRRELTNERRCAQFLARLQAIRRTMVRMQISEDGHLVTEPSTV